MNTKADFSDLATRVFSALVLALIGLGALWLGGPVYGLVLSVAAGLMVWELTFMHWKQGSPSIFSGLIAAACVLAFASGVPVVGVAGVAAVGLILMLTKIHARIVVPTAVVILFAIIFLFHLRSDVGLIPTIFVIFCVIASDIGGYFAGKMIGGPKLWVSISPKKTWSGTVGGWVLAALIGAMLFWFGEGAPQLIFIAVLIAIGAQIGDLLESAIKRRAGIKDSSHLIPGHGGLMDRFDGLVGAAALLAMGHVLGFQNILGSFL